MRRSLKNDDVVTAYNSLEKKGIKITYIAMCKEIFEIYGFSPSMGTLAKYMRKMKLTNTYDIQRLPNQDVDLKTLEIRVSLLERQVIELLSINKVE